MPQMVRVDNGTRSCRVAERCGLARSFGTRFLGLMGRATLEPDTGLLIYPTSSIHMLFMRFPLDVLFVDRADQVVGVREALPPWRGIAAQRGARYVIELPVGVIAATRTAVGDQLVLTPPLQPPPARQ